ncbi:23272_t:CDS:2 [Cetraspora pellucida]|uniref:23272_t:CDS:1 n=1 Tax=Cetraspora pellucida TaxID=1433469 RepID=A0A9N9H0R6_9GLOM|nr:23272_t:CDS:2 [Cetraspora pellucida]
MALKVVGRLSLSLASFLSIKADKRPKAKCIFCNPDESMSDSVAVMGWERVGYSMKSITLWDLESIYASNIQLIQRIFRRLYERDNAIVCEVTKGCSTWVFEPIHDYHVITIVLRFLTTTLMRYKYNCGFSILTECKR